MKVLVTGSSQGIGKAVAQLFLDEGHCVIGIDRQPSGISHPSYTHYEQDIRDKENLPQIDGIEILINNAGTQNEHDIDTNLKALIKTIRIRINRIIFPVNFNIVTRPDYIVEIRPFHRVKRVFFYS